MEEPNKDSEGISWEEFNQRMDKIFEDIRKLIQETNGSKTD